MAIPEGQLIQLINQAAPHANRDNDMFYLALGRAVEEQYLAVLEKVWAAIEGGPDHPWIPGANMPNLYPLLRDVLDKDKP